MHATIIARRRVLRIRPESAQRAGTFGLPLTAGDTHLAETWPRRPFARLYVAWPKVRRAVPSPLTSGELSSTPISTRSAALAGGESVTYPNPEGPAPPRPFRTASRAARSAPHSLPCHRGCAPPWCCGTGSTSAPRRPPNCSEGTVKSRTAKATARLHGSADPAGRDPAGRAPAEVLARSAADEHLRLGQSGPAAYGRAGDMAGHAAARYRASEMPKGWLAQGRNPYALVIAPTHDPSTNPDAFRQARGHAAVPVHPPRARRSR